MAPCRLWLRCLARFTFLHLERILDSTSRTCQHFFSTAGMSQTVMNRVARFCFCFNTLKPRHRGLVSILYIDQNTCWTNQHSDVSFRGNRSLWLERRFYSTWQKGGLITEGNSVGKPLKRALKIWRELGIMTDAVQQTGKQWNYSKWFNPQDRIRVKQHRVSHDTEWSHFSLSGNIGKNPDSSVTVNMQRWKVDWGQDDRSNNIIHTERCLEWNENGRNKKSVSECSR